MVKLGYSDMSSEISVTRGLVDMSSSFCEDDVTIRFVVPRATGSEDCCSEDLKRAFQVCLDHNFIPTWISEKDCMELQLAGSDVFVLEEFCGDAFHRLETFACLIIGPRCILDCLASDILIPKTKHPMYTVAMGDLIITSTGFSELLKKLKLAQLRRIPCVSSAWVVESIAHGHALPTQPFSLLQSDGKTSTPERSNAESPKKDTYISMIKKINMNEVKRAGSFLDGCNVYLSGFDSENSEKLRKIINSGGATRFNEISESVTHVIVGDFIASDVKILKEQGGIRHHVVTVEWLVESVKMGCPAPETPYCCLQDLPSPVDFTSPLSKKGLLTLHSQGGKHVRALEMASPMKSKSHMLSQSIVDMYATAGHPFSGLTFSLAGYNSVFTQELETLITFAGGRVVTHSKRFKGIPDYGVVPLHGASNYHTTTEVVTHHWLNDCAEERCVVPIKYYHQPTNFVLDSKPLSTCVVTATLYSGSELRYISDLLQGLGAIYQAKMTRVDCPGDGIQGTTHLLAPKNATELQNSGKYKAACNWNIPCVTHEWVLACARENRRAPEDVYLVNPDVLELVEWVDPAISNQQRQKQIPVFMLTCIDNREHYEEVIRDLDGIFSSAQLFDHTVSHIVCEQPSRNEKIMSSIAAGKWVLEKKFLDESKQVGHFLDEEDYEWGNPRASYTTNIVKPGSIGELLAQAIYRWRMTVQRTGKGAFAGMRAIVCAAKDKADLYKRLILAGGGKVLSASPPFSDPDNATVCIIELNEVQHPVDLRSLAEKRVPCVLPIYLNNFLIKDPPPDVNVCVIPEYKEILDALMRT